MDLQDLRSNYLKYTLDEQNINKNPFLQFEKWLNEAIDSKIPDPTAMNLATADNTGKVSSRIVLLKKITEHGFVFFTNYESFKSQQLKKNNNAALNFFWPLLERQIRIEGAVKKIPDSESETYFLLRPKESQVSAIVSPQSKIIPNKEELKKRRKQFLNDPAKIKKPNYWGGYLLEPIRFEFWQGGEHRLHDRINFVLQESKWEMHRLAP